MLTVYLIAFTVIGGLLASFAVAGWSSYNEGKLPATPTIFRWFLAGITASGISAYVWLFGAGGDPSKLIETVTNAFEVNEILSGGAVSAVSSVLTAQPEQEIQKLVEKPTEITVGMPNF